MTRPRGARSPLPSLVASLGVRSDGRLRLRRGLLRFDVIASTVSSLTRLRPRDLPRRARSTSVSGHDSSSISVRNRRPSRSAVTIRLREAAACASPFLPQRGSRRKATSTSLGRAFPTKTLPNSSSLVTRYTNCSAAFTSFARRTTSATMRSAVAARSGLERGRDDRHERCGPILDCAVTYDRGHSEKRPTRRAKRDVGRHLRRPAVRLHDQRITHSDRRHRERRGERALSRADERLDPASLPASVPTSECASRSSVPMRRARRL